jgi:hypothetical protein
MWIYDYTNFPMRLYDVVLQLLRVSTNGLTPQSLNNSLNLAAVVSKQLEIIVYKVFQKEL